MIKTLMAIIPIALLVILMIKRRPWPSEQALPGAALVFYLIRLIYFQDDVNLANATVICGLLTAWNRPPYWRCSRLAAPWAT